MSNVTEPRKTVKDAVDYYGVEWPKYYSRYKFIGWNLFTDGYVFGITNDWSEREYKVCTREEFEQEVARREREKWTHVFIDARCKILGEYGDKRWVLNEKGNHHIVDAANLGDIKTLTRAEAEKELGCIIKD